jgi:predicted kinase
MVAPKANFFPVIRKGVSMKTKLDRAIYVVMGKPAAGKTTVAHALSKNEGLMYLSSSVAKENLAKEHTLKSCLDEGFRDQSYDAITKAAAHNLSIGFSSVLDASFYLRKRRVAFYEAVKDKVAGIIIIYCFCNEETETAKRIKKRQLKPEFPHNRASEMEVYHHIDAGFEEPGFDEFPEGIPVSLIYLDTYTGASSAETWRNGTKISEESQIEAVLSVLDVLSRTVIKKEDKNG